VGACQAEPPQEEPPAARLANQADCSLVHHVNQP
jgi:hypothetical protein